ncbi:MAG TPA: sigma-70 family RNA polymerase sigma factor, partial [Solirubrobacteraceae bacterium]
MTRLDFDAACRAHRDSVVAAAAGILRDRDAAEDVAQDVFAGLWTHPERHDARRGSLRAYLVVLARHRALDAWRRQTARDRAHEALARDLDGRADADADAETRALLRERAATVRQALPRLAPAQRETLVLRYWAGLSDARIAAQTGVPLGTVKSRA